MKDEKKKEKPVPEKCVCGAAAITVKARNGHMVSCPDPMNCNANLRTTWNKHQDLAIVEWNNLVCSFRHARRR